MLLLPQFIRRDLRVSAIQPYYGTLMVVRFVSVLLLSLSDITPVTPAAAFCPRFRGMGPATARALGSRRLVVSAVSKGSSLSGEPLPRGGSVAIVGGGLAGLSLAHHILRKSMDLGSQVRVTVFDRESGPGTGGASAVAGG